MAECLTLIQGTRLRATLIDPCGNPVGGASSMVVSDGFVSVTMSDNIEAPDEFKVKNAGGVFCINQRSQPLLNWIETKINMCQVAPELLHLLTGASLVFNDATPIPASVGFGTDSDTYASASFALEVWTNIGKPRNSPACSAAGVRYGYLLLPWLIEGTIGEVKIENGPVSFEVTTITSGGNAWGTGPYNVVLNRLGAASRLLSPIPVTRHRHLQFTSLAPPVAVCGYQTLVVPS